MKEEGIPNKIARAVCKNKKSLDNFMTAISPSGQIFIIMTIEQFELVTKMKRDANFTEGEKNGN